MCRAVKRWHRLYSFQPFSLPALQPSFAGVGLLLELAVLVRLRPALWLTALFASLLGAVAAYLVLTVPNDREAGALLRQARAEVRSGDSEQARQSLQRVIQQYPRTDAAAAAAVALASLEADQRQQLARKVDVLQRTLSAQTLRLDQVLQKVNAPPPPPQIVMMPPPATPPTTSSKKPAHPARKPAHRARHGRR